MTVEDITARKLAREAAETRPDGINFEKSGASPIINELAGALAKAQALFQPAAKNKTNPHLKSKYADLVSVTEAVKKPLADNGLSYVQLMEGDKADITCITTLMHSSGQWIASRLTLHSKDTTPQAMGSAITYARRYGLSAMLGIVTDEEDDGESAQEKPKKASNGEYKHISVSDPKPVEKPKAEPEKPKADEEHAKLEEKAKEIFPKSKVVESRSTDETKNMLWAMAREVWPEDTKNCLNASLKNSGKKPVEFKTLNEAQAKIVHDHLQELLDVAVDEVPF